MQTYFFISVYILNVRHVLFTLRFDLKDPKWSEYSSRVSQDGAVIVLPQSDPFSTTGGQLGLSRCYFLSSRPK